MDLNTGDYIIIRGYNQDNFFSDKHFRKLLNKPTRVWDWGNKGLYVAHPDLDLVPLSDDVVYDKVIDSEDLPGHIEYKKKSNEFSKLTGHANVSTEKPLLKFLKKKNLKEEEELPKKNEKLLNIIQKINDGEIDSEFIDKFMGGIDSFIELLSKKNLLDKIDPFSPELENIQNSLFYALYQNDNNFIWKLVDKYLSDVTKIGDEYYLDIDDNDLAGFFNTYRDDISNEGIASIISGDHEFDYWEVTNDEYGDVYESLTPEHKKIVDDKIRSELANIGKLDINSKTPDLFDEIYEEQGGDSGEIIINDSVIQKLLDDDDSIKYLINQELDDIRRELYSLYSMCYQDTLNSEWYNDIMNALEGYIIDDRNGEEYSYKRDAWDKEGKRVTKTFFSRRYKATNAIYDIVSEWLYDNKDKNGYSQNSLGYFGNVESVLRDSIDYGSRERLRVPRLDDYPDHRKLISCINDNLTSYF